MAKTVFILGAGASRQAGGPLMADFLDKARDILDSGRAGDAKEAFELVFKARTQIKAAHSMAVVDIDNIEHVFATFEMANILGRLGKLKKGELKKLGPAIRKLIQKTIEEEIIFEQKGTLISTPKPYGNWGDTSKERGFIDLIRRSHKKHSPCVITFNYDLALDYGFYNNKYIFEADYALPKTRIEEGAIPILKLHGSLNWAKCDECKKTSFWLPKRASRAGGWTEIGPIEKESDGGFQRIENPGLFRIDSSRQDIDRSCVACGKALAIEPLIVPPTWNKAQHYKGIESVWKRAAEELSEAENIFIIGYSWPPNDHFFDSLYSLGTISEKTYLRRIWVFNPDKYLYEHFEKLLGQTAKKRFRFYSADFAKAIGMIRTVLVYGNFDPEKKDEDEYRITEQPKKGYAD